MKDLGRLKNEQFYKKIVDYKLPKNDLPSKQ